MAILFQNDHETVGTTPFGWAGLSGSGTNPTRDAGAAAAGTGFGLTGYFAGTATSRAEAGGAGGGTDWGGTLRLRFYINTNGATLDSSSATTVLRFTTGGTGGSILHQMQMRYTGSLYEVRWKAEAGAGDDLSSYVTMTDGEHWIEWYINSTAETHDFWIDDVSKHSATGISGIVTTAEFFMVGQIAGDASNSGTMFLDEFILNDTGAYIGPVSSASGIYLCGGNPFAQKLKRGFPAYV